MGCFQRQMGQVDLGVGDMAKIFYHGICNFISRLRYVSRFIIRFQNKSIPRLKRYSQISPGRHISTVARYIPSYRPALPRTLRSSSERRLALPPVQTRQSRLFSFVVPRWWNELPSTTRAGASLSTIKKLLKTQLFREHLPS